MIPFIIIYYIDIPDSDSLSSTKSISISFWAKISSEERKNFGEIINKGGIKGKGIGKTISRWLALKAHAMNKGFRIRYLNNPIFIP